MQLFFVSENTIFEVFEYLFENLLFFIASWGIIIFLYSRFYALLHFGIFILGPALSISVSITGLELRKLHGWLKP